MILGVPACPACLQSLQTCLYTITNCHIINPSLPHRRTPPPPSLSRQTMTTTTTNTARKCAKGWIGGRKGREKEWGLRCDLSEAPGTLFFLFFFDYTNTYIHLEVRLRDPGPGILYLHAPFNTATSPHQQPTRKGPNDARRVVWALCKFF